MTQNIYDKQDFFEGYSKLDRSVKGLDGAPEWPSIRALLPNLSGKRIVDLGCGFGWFSRFAMAQGAKSALGIDISEKMIAKARATTTDAAVTYKIADLENLELQQAAFDFAYSSLAFHYIRNFRKLIKAIYQALVPYAHFVFTIEHPIYTAPKNPKWMTDRHGNRIWPLNQYQIEGERITNWLAKGVIKQHRTLGRTINTLIDVDFTIRRIEEWRPTEEQLRKNPEWKEELDRPMFLLIATQRS